MLMIWLMVVKKKDAPLYNLQYLSKMHSIKETHQNTNHGYVWEVESWLISILLSRLDSSVLYTDS